MRPIFRGTGGNNHLTLKGFSMAYATAHTTSRPGLLRRTTDIVLDTLFWLGNIRPMIDEVERLVRTSDEALAARGTTRTDEIARIFGPRAHY